MRPSEGHALAVRPRRPCQASSHHPSTVQGTPYSKTRCRQPAVNRDLPRFLCRFVVFLSHVCSAEGLSEMRHQLTDTANINTTAYSFNWSTNSPWTSCSNTCGYGVQYLDRSCLNQRNELTDVRFCSGSSRLYRVCKTDNTQCPNYYSEYFSRQCSQHGEHPWQARPSVGGCQFACYGKLQPVPGQQVPTVPVQWMPDGTMCTRYSRMCDGWSRVGLSNGVCLQGHCLDVGCDGFINSTKLLDSCGVCGGDGSTCKVISAEFSEILPFGYNEVVEIPAGALNIRVYETSENFLAIMNASGQTVFNNNFRIQKSGRYEVDGMFVNYKRCGGSQYRPGGYEELTIPESTSNKIIILIVSTHGDSKAHAAYHYSLPLPPKEHAATTEAPMSITQDTADTNTNPVTADDDSDRVATATHGSQDLQNIIAIETVAYSDRRAEAELVTSGAGEQHSASHRVTAGSSDFEDLENLNLNDSTGSTDPFLVEEAETSVELQDRIGELEAAQTSEGTLENSLPESQNESLHQEKVSVGETDLNFADTVGSQFEINSPHNPLWKATDPTFEQDGMFSGQFEDKHSETTTDPTLVYSDENNIHVSENSSQTVVDRQPNQPPIQDDQTHSTAASHSPNPSPASKPALHSENDLFLSDGEDEKASHRDNTGSLEEYGSLERIPVTTNAPLTPTQRTAAEKTGDFRDSPYEYYPGFGGTPERLFEEIPEIMELVHPSRGSQEPATRPSAAAVTSIVVSRGDVPQDDLPVKPRYLWATTGVAPCSATCSRGMSRSYAYCTNHGEQVSDNLCDMASKPEVVERECGGKPCQPRWAVGSWSACTVTCGTGCNYRTVHCWLMIAPGLDTSISNSYCNQSNTPDAVRPCSFSDCGPQWQTSDWSECSEQCGEGVQTREVRCSAKEGSCNPANRPPASKRCMLRTCPSQWRTSQWDSCRSHCAVQFRQVDCVNRAGNIMRENACPASEKPLSNRLCGKGCTAQWVPQSYGPCQGECGSLIRRRKVVCAATSALSGRMQSLADSVCPAFQKPASESSCQLVSCQRQANRRRRQMPQWLTSPWSVCSVTCGTGQRTRVITCTRRRNQPHVNCNESKRPDSSESCNLGECPAVNPACSDSPTADCNVIRRANLCRYASYKRSCCVSCNT